VLAKLGEEDRMDRYKEDLGDMLYVLQEVEGQAQDNALHWSTFPWSVAFCEKRHQDSIFWPNFGSTSGKSSLSYKPCTN